MNRIAADGIEICEDLCECGARLRLHTYVFNKKTNAPYAKHYVDCEAHCGRVSDWKPTPEEAIESFDKEYLKTHKKEN